MILGNNDEIFMNQQKRVMHMLRNMLGWLITDIERWGAGRGTTHARGDCHILIREYCYDYTRNICVKGDLGRL